MSTPGPTTPEPDPDPDDAGVRTERRTALNEDWAATVVGLALLALVLLGAVPGWVVP